jgi:hypothetical protein
MPTASYQLAQPPHLSGRAPPTFEVLAACEAEILLLDWLLGELFKLGHKNLLFSRFTTRLDIIEVRASLPRYLFAIPFPSSSSSPPPPSMYPLLTAVVGLGRRYEGLAHLLH